MVRDTIGNGGHAKFPHAVVDVVSCMILFKRGGAFPDGQVAGCQIRRAAEQFWQYRPIGIQDILRSFTGGYFGWVGLQVGNIFLGCCFPLLRQSAAHPASKLCRQFRVGLFVSCEFLLPALLRFFAFLACVPRPVNLFGDFKSRMMPPQFLPGQRHLFFAQRSAVRFLFTGFIR